MQNSSKTEMYIEGVALLLAIAWVFFLVGWFMGAFT